MSLDISALNTAIAQYGPVHRVVITAIKGSSPREIGASMLVWGNGQTGSIGGGALEYAAAKAARQGHTGVQDYPLGPQLGQCCGGVVQLVTERFDTPIQDATYHCRRVWGDADRPMSITRHVRSLRNGTARRDIKLDQGWLSEGIHLTKSPVWVWGAGHVGRAVVQVLGPLPDFDITWVDDATNRFPSDIPSGVVTVPAPDLSGAMALAPAHAHHLIFTYSHALDLALCHASLQRGFASCGVIGSATKWARFRKRLIELGHAPAQVDTIACPIGDPTLGKHPMAIAVSVAHSLMSASESRDQRRSLGG